MVLNTHRRVCVLCCVAFAAVLLLVVPVTAAEVPSQLPDPNGKPGDAGKPVKVYILAGQSNMVGMGEISGAKCRYSGIYLTADRAAPKGPMYIYPVGHYKIAPLTVYQTDDTKTEAPIAEGQLEVPERGVYQVYCGFGESSLGTMQLDGKEAYRRQPGSEPVKQDVTLEPGKRYAFKISGFTGDPPWFWMQKTDLLGNGDLEAVTLREGEFPWLVDDAGQWTVRNDVYFREARLTKDGKGSPLSPTSNGRTIGPELGFGHVMGTYHDEQVLLIKTAQGNRSLGFDFRPPSSGRTEPNNKWEGLEYQLMIEGVRKTLDNIDNVVPSYQGQGYEIAGFAWWQGHKDAGASQAEYEKNLANLIEDVRKEFGVPKMPAVVATVGFGGREMSPEYLRILNAQLAVADAKRHPEFAGSVASVDIRDFWRQPDQSPAEQGHHYHRNAETYMLVGDALGRAMVDLLEGNPRDPVVYADIPPEPAEPPAAVEPSEEEKRAAQAALKPIVMDGMAAAYMADPRNNAALLAEAKGERPARFSQFLRGPIYRLTAFYRAAGIDDYDWRPFGPDLKNVEWDYYSFDPPETLDEDKGPRYRQVTYPAGMENWFKPEFDAKQAGFKTGRPPFGQLGGKLEPLRECDYAGSSRCGCGVTPRTLWEKEVLLVRGTFEVPALKPDHRYRIVVGGSNHVNAGEGFAIWVNGRLLAESEHGVHKRQGGQPRGAHIYADMRPEFDGGKVTIAATSFLRYNHPRVKPYPPSGHLTLWLEEQKVPAIEAADGSPSSE